MNQMEYNKNFLANGSLVVVTIMAVFLVGLLIFGNAGVDVTDKKQVSAGGGESNLSDEDQKTLDKEHQAFLGETEGLRQDIYKKRNVK
jgi:hypothetical protein